MASDRSVVVSVLHHFGVDPQREAKESNGNAGQNHVETKFPERVRRCFRCQSSTAARFVQSFRYNTGF